MSDREHKLKGSPVTGKRYWRSLEEASETPEFLEFLHREFPKGASELFGDLTKASRRGFLKLMGASLALAGVGSLGGCIRWPEQKVLPYAHRPPNRTPGVPVNYATALEIGGVAQGLLVTSYDGRPIKVEGNPGHPLNLGATDVLAQASVLGLYDPDRSRGVMRSADGKRDVVGWEVFGEWAKTAFAGTGEGIAVLSEATSSPSVERLRGDLAKKLPGMKWYEYEAVSGDEVREGLNSVHGEPLRRVLDLSKAKVIVAIDAELFGGGDPLAVKYARDFAAGRRMRDDKGAAAAEMNRLYVVESRFTLTGACADHRRAVAPSKLQTFVEELERALAPGHAPANGPASGVDKAFVERVIEDLKKHKGECLVVAGAGQNSIVHSLVAEINTARGAVGKTVHYYADPEPKRPAHIEAIKQLAGEMKAGKVGTLLIIGGNPVYDAPADVKFGEALKQVKNSVHLSLHDDETSKLCGWQLSKAHFLESWGDARTFDGTVSLIQPLIEPLFDGKSTIELLALLLNDRKMLDEGGYGIVRQTVQGLIGSRWNEWAWKSALHDGVVTGTAWAEWQEKPAGFSGHTWSYMTATLGGAPGATAYEVILFADHKTYDGRFANNGWLQELPDPMTRLTWDNAALMSPATASKLHVERDEVVQLTDKSGATIEVAAFFVPGMPDGVIGLALGYGRTAAGSIGNAVGENGFVLRTAGAMQGGYTLVTAKGTGRKRQLATVQDHHIIDKVGKEGVAARIPELIKEATFEQYRKDQAKVPRVVNLSLWNEHSYDKDEKGNPIHKWGLAIDLTSCTGCSACVTACQAENNIPIVGKEQVLHGREMHWLRLDRYFAAPAEVDIDQALPDQVQAVGQPVMCVHCENAPCEEVCPVAATTHSKEGLNMMTYNRCIGTRYCSNNCPYKVRRFNFFDYNNGDIKNLYTPNLLRADKDELYRMQKNPDVTVRMRGVMEKCTYCVQRIEQTRMLAKREGDRPIQDGEIKTACQQSCPTQAIVFGDLNDPNSKVTQMQKLGRSYGMLDPELNTKPRTQYLAKIRNPADGLDKELFRTEAE